MAEAARFPSPFEVEPIPGTEGWERMYPYHYLFSEDRRDYEEGQLWFYDAMHWPDPMPPFDVIGFGVCQLSLGVFTTRVFAIPPANGMTYRLLNGYLFLSPNAVTDPEEMGERAPLFQRRSSYYYEHWDELYENKWEPKTKALIDELKRIKFDELPKYEPESAILEARGLTSGYLLLENYNKLILNYFRAWQYHFEFLNLVYLSYLMFYDFCKKAFPAISDNTIARMVAGAPGVLMYRPDEELGKLAKLAVHLGVADVFQKKLSPQETIAELERSDQGKRWLEAMDRTKDPWFYVSLGSGFYHYDPCWIDNLAIPFGHIRGYIEKIQSGERIDRPVERIVQERERLQREYRELLPTEEDKKTFDQAYQTLAMAYPFAENHIFYIDHWHSTIFWQKMRELGRVLVKAGFLEEADDVFLFYHSDIVPMLEDLAMNWSAGPGIPTRGPHYWPREVKWRKGVMQKFREWTPPPALGPVPEVITEPFTIQLWGITSETIDSWLAPRPKPEEVTELKGFPASSGVAEGTARVITDVSRLEELQAGEILVCPITAPSWAPAFPKIKAAVTDIGGMSCHAAIVSREYGLPAVVGTGYATRIIKTGDRLKVDGEAGTVTIVR